MLTPGTRLGAYEIQGLLGSGGMGDVYRATDARLGRDVAVKVLPPEVSSDPERVGRFEREARAVAALNHPNILALYDVGVHPAAGGTGAGQPFLVTELLDGATLRSHAEGSRLPVRTVVGWAVQIASGLAAAHERSIVHRDLKPENVFVTADGRIKILDFGLAKLTQPEVEGAPVTALPTTPNTMPGVVMGTAGYMAPEQVRGLAADHRADIFALGAVVYELLAGRRAFTGETGMDVMMAVVKEAPAPLAELRPDVPQALGRVIERCLEKSPASRFQSTRDLVFALESMAGSTPAAATTAPGAPARHRAWRSWAPLAVGLAALLAGAALAVGGLGPRENGGAAAPRIEFDVYLPENISLATGITTGIALSPDGQSLAVAAGNRLWVRRLDSTTIRPLDDTAGATTPFWSPDGRSIAFFAGGSLKRLALESGLVTTMCTSCTGIGGTWSPTDVVLFGQQAGGIQQVRASGGQPLPATVLAASRGEVAHRYPQWLPDGRSFVYLGLGPRGTRFGTLWQATLGDESPRELGASWSQAQFSMPGHLLYVTEGALVAHAFDAARGTLTGSPAPLATSVGVNAFGAGSFAASEAGVIAYRRTDTAAAQLTWVDRSGAARGTLGDPGPYEQIQLSPDDSRVAAQIGIGSASASLVVADTVRGISSRVATGTTLTWSPTGRELAHRGGAGTTVIRSLDGQTSREIMLPPDRNILEDWSPDGRYLISIGVGLGLFAVPLEAPERPVALVSSTEPIDEPSVSRDGRWLAYAASDSGSWEVYVQPFMRPGERIRVSSGGGSQPNWRADGRELFYLALDGTMMAVPMEVSSSGLLVPDLPQPLFKTGLDVSTSSDQYAVAGDGTRFLVMAPAGGRGSAPLTVVVNWASGLGR